MLILLFTPFPTMPASYMALSIICILVGGLTFIFYKRAERIHLQKKRLEEEIASQKRIVDEQAQRLSREKISRVEMFRNIMETIQNPLSSIIGLNHAIMEHRYGHTNKNIVGASRIASNNGEKVLELVNDISELAMLEKENISLQEKYIDFSVYIDDLYHSLLLKAKKESVHLAFNNQIKKGIKVWLDTQKFEKIFVRLVLNAVSCTPKRKQIIISIEHSKEGKIVLSVEDSGAGIDKQEVQNMLDCYFRPDCKNIFHKYGLLPALIQGYADLFQGEFSVDSDIGKGTTFMFSFPVAKTESSSLEIIPTQAKPAFDYPEVTESFVEATAGQGRISDKVNSLKKLRGLIISNDEHTLRDIKQSLEDIYHALFAREKHEILSLLENYRNKIDFIVCSRDVAFRDQFQLIDDIKSDNTWSEIPMILIAEDIKASLQIKFQNIGINDYLIAPFGTNELLERIEQVTATASKRDEWHVNAHSSSKTQVTDSDLHWLVELEEKIVEEMSNRQFNLSELAYQMAISERQLFRKVKELTGQTPNKYLREMRIYTAKKLLEDYVYDTVAEVSYAVGFQDPHYFSKVYQKRFNKWPSEYLKTHEMACRGTN